MSRYHVSAISRYRYFVWIFFYYYQLKYDYSVQPIYYIYAYHRIFSNRRVFSKRLYCLIEFQVLPGNVNTYLSVNQELELPFVASRIRFVPFSTHPRTVCMRVEIYGCPWEREYIDFLLHRRVAYASRFRKRFWNGFCGRAGWKTETPRRRSPLHAVWVRVTGDACGCLRQRGFGYAARSEVAYCHTFIRTRTVLCYTCMPTKTFSTRLSWLSLDLRFCTRRCRN